MKRVNLACGLLMYVFIPIAQASVIHVTDSNGGLLGAKNVLVDGAFYDVMFETGTCIEMFNGCEDFINFTFDSQENASLAAQALLDSVFVDSESGQFGSTPELVNGCSSLDKCSALTPFESLLTFLLTSTATTYDGSTDNSVGNLLALTSSDTEAIDYLTWAVWSEANGSTPVPEPATFILLSLGIVGLMLSRRKSLRLASTIKQMK